MPMMWAMATEENVIVLCTCFTIVTQTWRNSISSNPGFRVETKLHNVLLKTSTNVDPLTLMKGSFETKLRENAAIHSLTYQPQTSMTFYLQYTPRMSVQSSGSIEPILVIIHNNSNNNNSKIFFNRLNKNSTTV